jgi:gliding motility-associated-like protein
MNELVSCSLLKPHLLSMNYLNSFRFLFIVFLSISCSVNIFSQESVIYTMGSGDVIIYECGTSAVFTDDNSGTQDAQDPYSCTNNTITFCPDVPGDAVQINFLGFDLQTNANPNNNDALYAYDGDNTGSNLVGVGTGNSFDGVSITASIDNPTGCVTFQFVCNNNASGGDIGWAATISCVTPCSYPVSGLELVSPEPFPNNQEGSISIGLCPDDVITFSAESAFGTDGFALQSLVWNWGDGDVEITDVSDGLIVPHSYSEPGEYIVTLTVVDENECNSTNLQPHQVLVSTLPIFNTEFTTPICAGSPGFLNGDPVQSITWTALPPVGVSELADLPDATGVAFTSELFLDFFEQGQVLENCEDIELITANIEHSFIGDLSFWITCPDGTEVILMDNGASGGPDPTGCTPADLGGNDLGIVDVEGWDYSWNMDAEWVLDDSGNPDAGNPMPSGIYLPCEDLCDFVGCPLNGIWTFNVIDQWAADNGTLFGWGIDFNPNIVPGVTTFTPVIGLDSDSSFWDVTTFDEGVVFISEDANYVDLEFPNPGIFDFTYQVTNNFGCTWDTTVNITVIEGPQTNISAGDDVIFCQDPVQLLGVFTGGGPSSCGGSGGSYDYCYSNNENMVFNYCPDIVGDGTMMTLNFSSGIMETCCDFINVFDGPDGTGNLIATFNTNIPGSTFTATNPDGCISFVLTSDGSVSCADVWANFEQLTWCVSCGGQDACGFDWSWTPTEYLDNPFVAQPTVLDFDGQATAYTLSVEPIGFDNCSATDVVMVLPGFEYEVNDQQPSCLADDGVLIVSINEPLSEGPFTIEFFEGGILQESLQFDGNDYVLQNLTPGLYSVDLFDDTGCLYTYEFEMLDPVPMEIETSSDAIICLSAAVVLEAWSDQDPADIWTYHWINSITGDTTSTVDGSFVASPLSSTIYTVFATDPNGCPSDDELINVNVLSGLIADLQGTDFICSGEEAQLDASGSFGGSGAGYHYTWLWEGNQLGALQNSIVNNAPPSSGMYCVIVNDDCETPPSEACMFVTIESPIDVNFVADTTKACGNGAFAFSNLIDPSLITTSVWDFGDGAMTAEMNTYHTYVTPGFYTVTLTINSLAGGCEYSATKESYINIYPLPMVGFYANPQPTTVPNTTITFDGLQSDNVVSWLWTFNSYNPLGFAIVENPVFTFPYDRGGFYPVKLEVEDIFGCTNQVTREIEIRDLFNLFIPTSFTPNNDGTNDAFFIQGSDIDPDRFELQIFNRWGEVVFETTDINDGWNGKVGTDGEYFSRNGTYTYRVEVHSISEESWRKEVFGYLMLIR